MEHRIEDNQQQHQQKTKEMVYAASGGSDRPEIKKGSAEWL